MLFLLGRNNNSNKNNEVKENIASKSEENLNVNNIEEDNNEDRLQYKILGTYNAKRPEGTEAFVYVFSENSVIFASDAYSDGTYIIDGDKIIVNSLYPELISLLEKNKFTPIPVRHRHRKIFGGGFHCFTLDLLREPA